jgi:hypothetical protein
MSIRSLLAILLVLAHNGQVVWAAVRAVGPVVVAERVRVAIVFDGPPLAPAVANAAIEELTAIWAPYGVHVGVANAGDNAQDGDIRLTVLLEDTIDRRLAPGALGAIRFFDGEPQPVIVMYPRAIEALVSTVSIAGSHSLQWPLAFHDAIVGRVLGRGLAHEVGHYLLRARHHSEIGLMRAPHAIPDLVAADRQHFALSIDDQRQLISTVPVPVASSLPVRQTDARSR